jgi:predicted transcriptional regulator
MTRTASLEHRVLEILWTGGEWSVRAVLERLGSAHAYTTILTVLDRLHRKRRVRRRKDGRAWAYRAARPREAELGDEIARLLATPGVEREPLLAALIESMDPGLRSRLDELIRCRREVPA